MSSIRYRTAEANGFKVFYREAGDTAAPKLLLLHGFPTAGHMFRDLIPLLADRFRRLASANIECWINQRVRLATQERLGARSPLSVPSI